MTLELKKCLRIKPVPTGKITIYKILISILPVGTSIDLSAINKVIAGVSTTARMVEILVKLMDKATLPGAR